VSHEYMLEMASLGAEVLQTRSVELAMAYHVPVRVLSSFVEPGEAPGQGTIVCDEEEIVEKRIVSGVAYSRDEAKISLFGLPEHPGGSSMCSGGAARRTRARGQHRACEGPHRRHGQNGVRGRQARRDPCGGDRARGAAGR